MLGDSFINWSLLSLSAPGWGGVLLQGFLSSIEIAVGGYALGLALGIGGPLASSMAGRCFAIFWSVTRRWFARCPNWYSSCFSTMPAPIF